MIIKKTFDIEKRKKTLLRYYKFVLVDSLKARELIKKLNYKNDPYLLQCIAQTYFDESLFNDNGSQREYFEARKLRLAEKYIIRAFVINENCIDVLWTLGRIRKAYGQLDLAIYCFKKIIELSKRKNIKNDNCTDYSLVKVKTNDSKFELYRLYHDKGDLIISKKYLSMYTKGLKNNTDTLYKPLENFLLDSPPSK